MSMVKHRDHLAAFTLGMADLLWSLTCFLTLPLIIGVRFSVQSALPSAAFVIIQLFFLALSGAYRQPRRWGLNEAVPTVLRSALPMLVILFLFGGWQIINDQSEFSSLLQMLVVYLLVVLPGLVLIQLLAGRIQLQLFRKGIGLRRSLVIGDGTGADYLKRRIEGSDWLGERIVQQVLGVQQSGLPNNNHGLMDLMRALDVDVVWLTDDIRDLDVNPLLNLITSKSGQQVIWRILPRHLRSLNQRFKIELTAGKRQELFKKLDYKISLPAVSVAMLGSRGVPANYSGVERNVEEIGSYLASLGERVVVYCHRRFISLRGRYRGMELRFMPTIPSKNLETIVHSFLSTLHVLVREEEIIQYQALGPATLAWLPRLFGRKVVVAVQGLDWQRAKWGRLARIYLKIGEWASAHFPHLTIVVSRTLFDYYQEKYPGINLVLIPNGYEMPANGQTKHLGQPGLEKDNYILFVGRLEPEKGCHLLIEAFSNISTDRHLVIAGRENYGSAYRQQLEAAAASVGNVHFTGFVEGESLAALYSNAYLVVLPSDIEGLSLALLEALSYGNCVLVSDIRENQEAVQNMGVTFQNGSGIDLAQKLQYLCDNPGQIEKKRVLARKLSATHMGWEEVALATLQTYKELINGD